MHNDKKTAVRPELSFLQIWNMCFGFFGIQMGFALQNANVSRIFQSLGASVEEIPILWIAAPVTGLLVQPIVGYYSDRTWGRLGRRRPYFLFGAIATTAALLFMPHAPGLWIAAATLWIMDASINVSMEPFRAFVGDNLPEEQRSLGFAMQSFFIGTGAILASALPWIFANWLNIDSTAATGEIPDSVRYAFYTGGAGLLLAVCWTVFSSEEYAPEQLAAFAMAEDGDTPGEEAPLPPPGRLIVGATIAMVSGVVLTALVYALAWDQQLLILAFGLVLFAVALAIATRMLVRDRADNGFAEVVLDFVTMPATMRQLAVVQFFSWFALFAMWIYATAAVTSHHFGTSDTSSAEFNAGADWVGVLFAAYNGFAALAAVGLPWMARRVGRRGTHAIALLCGAAAFASFFVIQDPGWLLLSMVGVGIAWASILSMPYAILSIHLPAHKMGVYMGIFNFFIVLPQIVAASLLGLLLRELFGGEPIYAMALGASSLALAALCLAAVEDGESTLEAGPHA